MPDMKEPIEPTLSKLEIFARAFLSPQRDEHLRVATNTNVTIVASAYFPYFAATIAACRASTVALEMTGPVDTAPS